MWSSWTGVGWHPVQLSFADGPSRARGTGGRFSRGERQAGPHSQRAGLRQPRGDCSGPTGMVKHSASASASSEPATSWNILCLFLDSRQNACGLNTSYSCNQNYSTPHCTLGLLAKYTISQLFAINKLHKNCLSSLMKLILQGFYPNSTQNYTFNDFNEFTAVSKWFNPFMTSIFSTCISVQVKQMSPHSNAEMWCLHDHSSQLLVVMTE